MNIVQRMRAQLAEAMKSRDAVRTGFLRYWIANLTLGTGAEVEDAEAIKKMRGILKDARSGPTSFSEAELALIKEWVPPALTREQIAEALVPVRDQIKAAPKDGMAIGIAMKALSGKDIESEEVRAEVASLRQGMAAQ